MNRKKLDIALDYSIYNGRCSYVDITMVHRDKLVERSIVVIGETIDTISELYGDCLHNITVERLVIGIFFTGVKLSIGHAGISYTPVLEMHDDVRHASPIFTKNMPARFRGMTARDILYDLSDTPMHKTVKITVLNALSALFLNEERYSILEGIDVLDCVNFDAMSQIGMVGAFPSFLQKFKTVHNVKLSVIEKKRESLTDDDAKYFVPADQAPHVIPLCDILIVTGASIANGTIDALLSYARYDARIIVVGPTASFLPDAFFRRGVDIVSGVSILEPDKTLDMLSEGIGAYHLFRGCVKKINIREKNHQTRNPLDETAMQISREKKEVCNGISSLCR
ncbi:MAG: DUF364 domain-containing protein [Syntrophorhabdaceae bacterium]|nr:DUF364 domain-containing protein [Syntrophorhabdaceae bacterium]MDD4196002.1 DUF364 domain-containing protein [Syntrophorhabdaceae bacterium]